MSKKSRRTSPRSAAQPAVLPPVSSRRGGLGHPSAAPASGEVRSTRAADEAARRALAAARAVPVSAGRASRPDVEARAAVTVAEVVTVPAPPPAVEPRAADTLLERPRARAPQPRGEVTLVDPPLRSRTATLAPAGMAVPPPAEDVPRPAPVPRGMGAAAAPRDERTTLVAAAPPMAEEDDAPHSAMEEQFFSSNPPPGDVLAGEVGDDEEIDPRLARKSSARVRARRERYAQIVRYVVGVAAAVIVVAGVRSLVGRGGRDVATPVQVASADVLPAANTASAAEARLPVAVAPPPAAVAEEPEADVPGKTALEEKKDAQRDLDRGNAKKAAEAAERSVALDPTDGEAWLLLGASYQELGKGADARRAFLACTKEGKKGPLGECRAMLR